MEKETPTPQSCLGKGDKLIFVDDAGKEVFTAEVKETEIEGESHD